MENQLKGILAILGKTYSLPPEIQSKVQSISVGDGILPPPPYASKEEPIERDPLADDQYQNVSVTRVAALEEAIRLAHLAKVNRLVSDGGVSLTADLHPKYSGEEGRRADRPARGP